MTGDAEKNEEEAALPALVAPDGRPARLPKHAACPRCGAAADQRMSSSGFGRHAIEICKQCGYRFPA
jgi:transcription elongation factor Elf1